MEHVSLNNHFGLSGKVMIDGQERLLIGGFEKNFWFIRTEKGWVEVADNSYKRYMAAISNTDSSSQELMVTGGSQESSHYMEIFSDSIWRIGPDLPESEGKQNHCQVTYQGEPYIVGGHVGNERNVRYRVILHSRLVSVKHNLPSKMKFIIVELVYITVCFHFTFQNEIHNC